MPEATLRPYEPSWRDRLAALLMGDSKPSPERARLVEGLMGSRGLGTTGMGVADFVPGGQAMSAQEAYRDTGDPRQAALAMLPIPGASKAGAAGRGLEKGLEKALAEKLIAREIPGKPSVVKIPGTGEMPAMPIKTLTESADQYMRSVGRPGAHEIGSYPEFDEGLAKRIAQAFDEMQHNPGDPKVKRAYDAMIEETLAQYRGLKDAGIDISFMKPGQKDPYAASPAMGYEDLVKNGHLWTFPTDQGHGTLSSIQDNPLLKRVGKIGDLDNATANDAFRVVHDIYGHFGPGNPFFRHKGEERAWVNHSRMYSDEALPAMTSETRGQNSWLNFGPYGEQNRNASGADTVFADQKVGVLPEWAYADARTPQGIAPAPSRVPEITTGAPAAPNVSRGASPLSSMADTSRQAVAKALSEGAPEDVAAKATARNQAVLAQGQLDLPAGPEFDPWRIQPGHSAPMFDEKKNNWYVGRVASDDENALKKQIAAAEKKVASGKVPPLFTEADLYDPPSRPLDLTLPSYAKGTPDWVTAQLPGARERAIAAILRGKELGGPLAGRFYEMGRVYDDAVSRLGKEEGEAFLDNYGQMMGATTAFQAPQPNHRAATLHQVRQAQGLPLAADPGYPYGHMYYQGTHAPGVQQVMDNGIMDSESRTKGTLFGGALSGTRDNTVIDQVETKGMGITDKGGKAQANPPGQSYTDFMQMRDALASELGYRPKKAQALSWAGFQEKPSDVQLYSKPHLFNIGDRANVTGLVTGLDPKDAYLMWLMRKLPHLAAAGGAVGLGAAALGSGEGPDPQL